MTRTSAARVWGGTTAVIGAVLLIRPAAVTARVSAGASTPDLTIVRVLGGRQLLQGGAVLVRPGSAALLRLGSVVDLLHAASMVAAATLWPRYRRPALASAVLAGTSAAAGALIGRRRR
ncbi:hypothetical protein SAMN04515671_0717 [Nakamurella panacisegetis]|uniref:Uncharacterized protein n=1 Tax=Nakamurella panacisegetis TaxID=1090615 RepID=A0A1H0IZ88_9ACTN|nr:hypothetical protein [Nakamurella panacisegetis]SDO36807.1 hypothetical protein SAMN04515671_0717 [Nakamurella panacisegetis]